MQKSKISFTKKAYSAAVLAAMLVVTLIFLSACSSESALVGRWEAVSIGEIEDGETFTEYLEDGELILEFFSDGNGASTEMGRTESFTWTAENGRLMITEGRDTVVADYAISRSTLTITIEDDWGTSIMTFDRVN